MAEENKYNHDSINELLTWAKETLNNKRYPSGEFQLDKCAKILDCGKYLDSMIAVDFEELGETLRFTRL